MEELAQGRVVGKDSILIALAGNPNVGKSTLFNRLTGGNQHTGNWPGKTVEVQSASFFRRNTRFTVVDLPGTYSLRARSREEEIARDFIIRESPDVTVAVLDATCLERNLAFALQIIEISRRSVVCLNFMDEMAERGIRVDLDLLQRELGVPVVGISARNGIGIDELLDTVERVALCAGTQCQMRLPSSEEAFHRARAIVSRALLAETVEPQVYPVTLSPWLWWMLFVGMLTGIFFLTLYLSNLPSQVLAWMFDRIGEMLERGAAQFETSITRLLLDGVYRTVTCVVSVMLPPMAIFFPLFALMEDAGFLPRLAFMLDPFFRPCGAHGKQALCMCMGLGCNAVGVVSARIIDSPRERLAAIITNTFMPCNGRFPTLVLLFSMFLRAKFGAALGVFGAVVAGVLSTFAVCWVMSRTVLRGLPSAFVLELPPLRVPDFKTVVIRTFRDKTFFVLKRAVTVAAPFGALCWLMANTYVGASSLLSLMASALDLPGKFLGLDGKILTGFIMGFPANEIVLPVALMAYASDGRLPELPSPGMLKRMLVAQGWTPRTAVLTALFSILHYPCGTTLYTVYKETRSRKWTALAFFIPLAAGIFVLSMLSRLWP